MRRRLTGGRSGRAEGDLPSREAGAGDYSTEVRQTLRRSCQFTGIGRACPATLWMNPKHRCTVIHHSRARLVAKAAALLRRKRRTGIS
jgi:hypothetical protein